MLRFSGSDGSLQIKENPTLSSDEGETRLRGGESLAQGHTASQSWKIILIQCDVVERPHILVSEFSGFTFLLCNSWLCDSGHSPSLL